MTVREILKIEQEKLELKEDEIADGIGLPICKKCHTPRYVDFRYDGGGVVRILCQCQAEQQKREEEEERKNKARQDFISKQKLSMVCQKYMNARFETATITEHNRVIYQKCKTYTEKAMQMIENNIGLYIYGDNSSGKTYLTFCICNELIDKGYSVTYTSVPTIVAEIQKSYNSNGLGQSQIIEMLSMKQFLFIDDLGKEFMGREYNQSASKFAEKILLEVINARYNNGLPTIFTSNYSIGQLSTVFNLDKAILERINEMATKVFKLDGDNFRDKLLKEKNEKAKQLGL